MISLDSLYSHFIKDLVYLIASSNCSLFKLFGARDIPNLLIFERSKLANFSLIPFKAILIPSINEFEVL